MQTHLDETHYQIGDEAVIPIDSQKRHLFSLSDKSAFMKYTHNTFRKTPIMVTFYEGVLTHIDIQKFIEMGLSIVRFRVTNVTKNDKIKLLQMLRKAQEWVCEKHDVSTWPLAVCIDMPNAAIRSGYIDKSLKKVPVLLEKGDEVTLTADPDHWNKCTNEKIYIDDPYTIQDLKVGAEITFCGGGTKVSFVKQIDHKSILCKVKQGGELFNNEYVTLRGGKYKKPPFSKIDLDIVALAKELQFDVIIAFSVRFGRRLPKLRKLCGDDYQPLIVSTICDQEGLDDIDEIIKNSDGIILAREYLTHHLINRYSLASIQLQVGAKCKQAGKPFFVSGHILEQTLIDGTISTCDVSDITNAILQGSGFVLRHYKDAVNALKAMQILDNVCKTIETSKPEDDLVRQLHEHPVPVNAADACVAACAIMARQCKATIVVLPTVTGRTAVQLASLLPYSPIITISRKSKVARKMQLYRGISAIIYDKPILSNWTEEINARVTFAISYSIKRNLLKLGDSFVAFHKSTYSSPFCDNLSQWMVNTAHFTKYQKSPCPSTTTFPELQNLQ